MTALARQRCKFFGKLFAEPNDTSTASCKDLSVRKRLSINELALNQTLRAAQQPKAAVRLELLPTPCPVGVDNIMFVF